jgi:hypothetical protein
MWRRSSQGCLPVRDATSLLGRHFEDILEPFRHVLTASYFSFAGQFYEQTDSVAMGFPTASGYHQLLHGGLRGEGARTGYPQAPLLVTLSG